MMGPNFLRQTGGAAAVEFALMLGLLTVPMLSVVDVGVYTYDKIQLENAAQVASQAAWSACSASSMLPVTNTSKCSGAQTVMTNAAQTTSLGNAVTLSTVTEGYYCVNSAGVLTLIGNTGTFGSPPTVQVSCGAGTWLNGTAPGDYITVTASFTYTPIFGGISVASLLTPTITKISTMRMG